MIQKITVAAGRASMKEQFSFSRNWFIIRTEVAD
jgi:hypothetical protein